MKISEFSYRNILSYGNKLQTIKFDGTPGLVQVSGANGNGKSAIKEALTVSIYGRSAIRKMKDIPNWINRNAFTSIKFTTNRGEEVELTRGIDPNYSDIKINGVQFNLPDKRKVDEFIEDELAKIPFSVFSNTISLSFDDFKSFVNLSKEDKRKIVDRIFGIDILADMRAQLKKDIQENKKAFDILDSNVTLTEVNIENYSDQLTQLKKRLAEKKNELVTQLTNKVNQLTTDLETSRLAVVEINNKIQLKIDSKSIIESELGKTKNTIRDLTSKLTTYSKNRCPQCLNDLKSESSLTVKNNIDSKIKELSALLPSQEAELSTITSQISEITLEKNKLSCSLKEKYSILLLS
jgi:DNA repair exonuclease SbcCD ATPase subunit